VKLQLGIYPKWHMNKGYFATQNLITKVVQNDNDLARQQGEGHSGIIPCRDPLHAREPGNTRWNGVLGLLLAKVSSSYWCSSSSSLSMKASVAITSSSSPLAFELMVSPLGNPLRIVVSIQV
jgi:hypothetical protein